MPADDQQLIATIHDWLDREVPFALATVVGVRGSTYRGLAARQLVAADGTSVGTVSGGCLDSDLVVVAARVRAAARPELVEFDLTADDEAVWGWGIGCNGVTELLVEPGRLGTRSGRGDQIDAHGNSSRAVRARIGVAHPGDLGGRPSGARKSSRPGPTAAIYGSTAEANGS